MKRYLNILLGLAVTFGAASCWKSELPEASSSPRHQVTDLVAAADDESVELSWNVPDGWSPVDYVITYLNIDQETETVRSNGAKNIVITGLENGHEYLFNVQAEYEGKAVSGTQSVKAKPATRGISNAKVDDAGDQTVTISWIAPSYDDITGYTADYQLAGDATSKKTVTFGKENTSYTFTGLTNEKEYTFSIAATYPSKTSKYVAINGTPTKITPWKVDKTEVVAGEIITFSYDQSLLPASDVKWILPGGITKTGNVVKTGVNANYAVDNNDVQQVSVELQATVAGSAKKWTIYLSVKPFMFFKNDWDKGSSAYQGFKADTPVFSPDGKVVYALTFASPAVLYALDAKTGVEKWRYKPGTASASYNGCTVNPVNGDIYFGTSTAGQFYCVKADGTLKWSNSDMASMDQAAFPAVSKDGKVVYCCDKKGMTFALDAETGAKKWSVQAGSAAGAGIIVNGDEIIVGTAATTAGIMFLKASDGSTIASLDVADALASCGGFAVSPDRKNAYIGTAHGSVISVDIVAHSIVATVTPPQDNTNCNIWELAVSADGSVFGGSKRGYAFCLKGVTLDQLWVDETLKGVANAYNFGHPCCDTEGNFYISSGGSKNQNLIFSPAGAILEQWTDFTSANQKQMAGNALYDGVYYALFLGAGSENGAMVARNVGAQLGNMGWPCHGGDICGSCCIK